MINYQIEESVFNDKTYLKMGCYICQVGICEINSKSCYSCKNTFCVPCSKKLFKGCRSCQVKFCEACSIGFVESSHCLYCRPKSYNNRQVFGLIGNKIKR